MPFGFGGFLLGTVQLAWGLVVVRVVSVCFSFLSLACLLAFIVYFVCTLLHLFASAFNIFSLFTYKKKSVNESYFM